MATPPPAVEIVTVTPQQAQNWLDHAGRDENRRTRPRTVALYAADMAAGRWHLSDQALSFGADGKLSNGRHRLTACVRAGRPFVTLLLRHLPAASFLVLDDGLKRSTDDQFRMAGRDWPRGCGATVRRIVAGITDDRSRSFTNQEVDEFMHRHGEAVAFAHTKLSGGQFGSASLRAPVARAAIAGRDRDRLAAFCYTLATGMMVPGDEAAVRLRTFVTDAAISRDRNDRKRFYALCEAALTAFLARERVGQLRPAEEELFPLPGERPRPRTLPSPRRAGAG